MIRQLTDRRRDRCGRPGLKRNYFSATIKGGAALSHVFCQKKNDIYFVRSAPPPSLGAPQVPSEVGPRGDIKHFTSLRSRRGDNSIVQGGGEGQKKLPFLSDFSFINSPTFAVIAVRNASSIILVFHICKKSSYMPLWKINY
ncbi:hypothetical protein AVEN_92910-1 [Araneus ventricosus]|uniref:Uncharacterized protein n=1 Tax=Araneus ventricosus TaxID=182803 RepID=A0A4Y2D051_ARAVE|nr:hypothetical protein AVEN_92910-1 [Araneus ventricosus]